MSIKRNEDLYYILARIENEGFDYCFRHYSNFEEIDDVEFHRLRLAYISAANELEEYIKKNS